jgi:YVTN family beta-propeller protein
MVIKLSRVWLLVLMALAVSVQAQDDPLYALPGANEAVSRSASIDLARDGRTLIAANMLNNTVSLVDLRQRVLLTEIDVGDDPRSVAFSFDGSQALVVNRGDRTLSVIDVDAQSVTATYPLGVLPYGVVTTDNQIAYVSLQASHEVIAIDYTTGAILFRIPTPPDPMGLALWGDLLYVTHFWSGDVSLIYVPSQRVVRTVETGPYTSLSPSITIDSRNQRAYIPQSRSYDSADPATYDTRIQPVVQTIDLLDMDVLRDGRVGVNVADRPVNMPFAVAVDPIREWAYIANAGTNDLSIIDLNSGVAVAHLPVGTNPRGVLLNFDNSFAYVHNAIEGSLTVISTRDSSIDDVLPISDLRIPVDELIGAELFHTAENPRMGARWISCASCHFDGQTDGRVWDDFPGGPRNTPVLYDLGDTAPYNWSGTWDEIADVELKIRGLQVGSGLIDGDLNDPLGAAHGGLALDLDILSTYLATLPGPLTPFTQDSVQVQRGEALFEELTCASCHVPPNWIDAQQHDVGTGGVFDTPTLNWLWQSAPYFHDGRARTLQEVFILPGDHQLIDEHSLAEINDLVAYLRSLP